ncbi:MULTISPECIES: hypothetical protein [Enterobacteriaceae]|uniref:hypothetical protein n=1 Tax=Enterobacteriaceae TaxID=543 RepID=UPI0019CFFAEB|nr:MULTISPECIES: hypothetical protein [Enterobacter cloacae complex]MCO7413545.1 hypothetical protein [Enterobacter asburiae]UBM18618.1 hypothetical protein LBF07_21485 [Enterobacter cloacae complex sp. ECL352]
MSEFKGTPGPWKYTVRNVNEMMTTFHGVAIGETYIESATRNEREDAQLISAAPELLEALQDFMAESAGNAKSCGHDFECICRFDKARAAIAKALGK